MMIFTDLSGLNCLKWYLPLASLALALALPTYNMGAHGAHKINKANYKLLKTK